MNSKSFHGNPSFGAGFLDRGFFSEKLKSLSLYLLLLFFSSFVHPAEKSTPTPAPARPTVIIPYDSKKPVSSQMARRIFIDYDSFQAMWKKVKDYRISQSSDTFTGPKDYILSTALYRIRTDESSLKVTGRISLTTRGTGWQSVPIPFQNAPISNMNLDGKAASYQGGSVVIEESGHHILDLEFEVALDRATASAKWGIPSAGATLLEIEMDSPLAEPVLQQNWPLEKTEGKFFGPEGASTFYTAAIGQQNEIRFRRRLKTSGRDMTRPNMADIEARLFVAPGLERLEATYHLHFEGQEENRFTIGFDQSVTPIQFEIPNLASWEMESSASRPGVRTLTFTLTQPVRDSLDVRLIGERLIKSKEEGVDETFPRFSADTLRIEQHLSLLRANDLTIKTMPGPNLRQINFPLNRREQAGFHPVAAYFLSGGDDALTYRTETASPERKITASYLYQVGEGKLETIARFQIRSPEAALFSSTLRIPADAKIQIVSGNRVKDWWRTGDELFVRYSGGTPETTNLLVYVAQQLNDDSQNTIPLVPFYFAGIKDEDLSGSGLIVAHVTRDTSLKLNETRQVVHEIGLDEVHDESEVLAPLERKRAFQFERMNFSGLITLKKSQPKFDALWVMLAQMHENWTRLSLHVDVEVTRSGLDRIKFTTPESMPELRVLSDDVREMRHTLADGVRQYELVFQQFVTDAISFTLETETPHDGTVTLPDLSITDASRQERFVIVENRSNESMNLSPGGMETTVPSLLPYKPAALHTARIFRAQPNWSLQATMEQLETTAGNQAVILYASLTSAFRSNGEEWLKVVYHMQNRSLQFLPVQKPNDSELVSVIVAGAEVRADRGLFDGKPVILIPLIQTKPGQLAYDVELVFRSRETSDHSRHKPATKLKRHLDDPAVFGLTVENTLWNIFLPKDHRITRFDGNMRQVQPADNLATVLQCDLTELAQLNYIGGDFDNGTAIRQASVGNGGLLVQRIENDLRKLEVSRAYRGKNSRDFRSDLEKQKATLTSNRKQISSSGNIQDQQQGQDEHKPVDWGFGNSGKIVSRNHLNLSKSADQIARVKKQVRLNDNISITGKFVEGDKGTGEKDSKQKNEEPQSGVSQIGRLSGNQSIREVNRKISSLNTIQSESQAVNGGDGGLEAAEGKKPAGKAKSESSLSRYGEFDNARSSLSRENGPAAPPGNQAPMHQLTRPTQKAMAEGQKRPQKYGEFINGRGRQNLAFRAQGRNSVSVTFPVEGEAFYFQKLKSHAELDLTSTRPSRSKRGRYFLLLLLSVAILWLGKTAWRRRRRATLSGE